MSTAGTPDHVYEIPAAVVRTWLGEGRFARLGTRGSGSCFFHAVATALNRDRYRDASESRKQSIVSRFRCAFQSLFDARRYSYLSNDADASAYQSTYDGLCNPHAWANETTIKHAADVLNLNIIFLDFAAERLYCGVHGRATLEAVSPRRRTRHSPRDVPQRTIILAWVNRSHFELIVRVVDVRDDGSAAVKGVFDPRDIEDARTIQHVMRTYAETCGVSVHDAHV
jgi:hypothetical protein